jgi:ABC-2 type transport system permease protein
VSNAFLYLVACSFKNRVLGRLRRLREPRYLAGAVAGGLYLYWAFIRQQLRYVRRARPGSATALVDRFAGPLQVGGAVLMSLFIVLRWIFPPARPPLQFSSAEVQFLFTAPVPRRNLVHYKLLRSQIGVVFSTLIALLFAGAAAGSNRLSFLLGLWLLFATLRMHLVGVSLNRASLVEPGGRRRLRSWLPLAITVALSVALVVSLAIPVVPLILRGETTRIPGAMMRQVNGGPAGAALFPLTLLIRPVLARWPWGFLHAVWPALLLFALNYLWVLRSDARLEEAAVETERRRSEGRGQAPRVGIRRAPFALAAAGRPEMAILWKNLLMLSRYASIRNIIRFALPLVAMALAVGVSSRSEAGAALAPICLVIAATMAVLGPQMVRNDLRLDLAKLSILKTWPLSGEAIIGGELLAPALIISVVAWVAILLALLLSVRLPIPQLSVTDRLALAVAAMIVVPPIALVQLVVQNGVAVLFPGWVAIGPTRPRGNEAMGQQMLLFAATILLAAVGLLPAVAAAGFVAFLLYWIVGWTALIPAAALVALVLATEVWLAVRALGRVLERTDLSALESAE